MELWGEIWNLHRDRPPVFFQVREACATMLRNRHHEDVPPRTLLQAYLTLLEYCGDFQLQSCMLNVILSDGGVRHYYDWFAAAWFAGRPKTCKAFVHLVESKLSCNDFLTIFNNELELQFIFSARCVLVRWQDEPQEHEEQVWLHLNCGTKTLSLTGLQAVPTEFSAQEMFILKSTEIKKVKVLNLESDHGFGKLQGIEIVTSKGQLFVQTDPHILDWTMFSHFVNFIFKVTVEFESYSKKGSNLTDCNGNEPSESKNDFGQSFNFNGNPLEDAILLQPVVQNSVFQVSSSQDALKTLAINSDSNDIEICYHNKQVSHKSFNDSDTADESHDQISVPVDKFLKKDCEEENNAKVNCSLEDTDNCEESQQHHLSDSIIANSQEDSNLLPLHASKLKMPQYADLYVEKTPDTEEDTTVSHLITAVDNDAHVTEMADPKTKSKRGRRKGSNISRKPRMTSPKAKGESHEDSEKSDNELIGTPRRITRRYTLHLKDALGTDCDSQFKAPTELPKSVNRKRLNNRKRKSDDGANFITEVETSTTSAILPCQPATEDTIETSPSKLVRPSSGEESGTFTAADEILQSTSPPKVPHPDSMPTLETPIATPVREPEDSLIQPDFINIHEKLNEELKSDTYKEDTMYVSPGSPPTIPSNMGPSSPPAIPAYLLQGPPPAIPLHANASQRPLVYRNYNMCLPPKHRKYDDDDDFKSDNCDAWEMNAMDSSSDASFLDNAGSAVLLPADDNGFSSTPDTLKVTVPIGDMNNLQQFSEICSHVETTDEHQ